ncbi:MAG: ParA family protein [Thermotogaceae bacterium]|nr:ParA family protein [Thermotogaceae bacterium]RKX43869.1 MAG: ParA family protein [Thermotogota bacterium]
MAKTIVFSSRKGGSGKTTLAFNTCALLADMSHRCLLVDMDSQAHATIHAGLEPFNVKRGVYEVLVSFLKSGAIEREALVRQDNMTILPTNENIAALDVELKDIPNGESVLKDFLMEFDRDFDYIVIDTPPSLGLVTINSLVAADYLVIPVRLDFFSLVGLAQVMSVYYKVSSTLVPNLRLIGLVPIMFSARARVSREALKELEKTFGEVMVLPRLRTDVKVVEASSHGVPVHKYAPKCRAAADLKAITLEILKRVR